MPQENEDDFIPHPAFLGRSLKKAEGEVPACTFHIITASAGHVLVGRIIETAPDGIKLADAAIIRRWGTTLGLGQLCTAGRQKETITDYIGTVFIPASALIFIADAPAWASQ